LLSVPSSIGVALNEPLYESMAPASAAERFA